MMCQNLRTKPQNDSTHRDCSKSCFVRAVSAGVSVVSYLNLIEHFKQLDLVVRGGSDHLGREMDDCVLVLVLDGFVSPFEGDLGLLLEVRVGPLHNELRGLEPDLICSGVESQIVELGRDPIPGDDLLLPEGFKDKLPSRLVEHLLDGGEGALTPPSQLSPETPGALDQPEHRCLPPVGTYSLAGTEGFGDGVRIIGLVHYGSIGPLGPVELQQSRHNNLLEWFPILPDGGVKVFSEIGRNLFYYWYD